MCNEFIAPSLSRYTTEDIDCIIDGDCKGNFGPASGSAYCFGIGRIFSLNCTRGRFRKRADHHDRLFRIAKVLALQNDDRLASTAYVADCKFWKQRGDGRCRRNASTKADIDFDALDGELAKLEPPKLSLTDVLDRLRKRLVKQQAKGVTVAQMHEVLKSGGIDITERSLRTFRGLRACTAGKEGCRGCQGHGVRRRR